MGNRTQFQVKIFFLVLFFFLSGGLWVYELHFVKPVKECEAVGHWWYKPGHTCLTPVRITDLTGRHMDDPDLTTEQGRAQAAYDKAAAQQAATPQTGAAPAAPVLPAVTK